MKIKKKVHLISVVAIILILLIIIIVSGNKDGGYEKVSVEKRDLKEIVRISGVVKADTVANLGFETTGTVKNIYSKVNDRVKTGQSIATLNLGTLLADLKSAQAEVIIKNAEKNNESLNLDTVKRQQDTLVNNAYEELLSNDLIAEPDQNSYTQTPPTITGRYSGNEGTYTIDISSGYASHVHLLRTFGLEETKPIDINKTGPTKLGTKGLFIDFPDDLSRYDNTIWYVNIPNKTSSSYSEKLSIYKDAVYERTKTIEEAESNIRTGKTGTSIDEAELAKAEAEVERIKAQILDRTLTAPFSGTITRIDIDPGEIVSANQSVVSIISDGKFGIAINLPEIDSTKVMLGDKAEIKLDAFKNEIFTGKVKSINRSETTIDGISVYEARIELDDNSDKIFSGMTADVEIITDEKTSVVSVPLRAIKTDKEGLNFIKTINKESGDIEEIAIKTGLESTDGYIEIISGINEGDFVLIDKK